MRYLSSHPLPQCLTVTYPFLRRGVLYARGEPLDEREQLVKIEGLRQHRAVAGLDELLGALTRVAGGEDRTPPELWLEAGSELEEHVATHVGDPEVDHHAVEVL